MKEVKKVNVSVIGALIFFSCNDKSEYVMPNVEIKEGA